MNKLFPITFILLLSLRVQAQWNESGDGTKLTTSDNVGIGTLNPNEKLEIKNGSLRFNGYTSSAYGSLGKLDFFNSFSSSNVVAARIEGKRDSYSHKDGRLSFYTADINGNLKERLTIDRDGILKFNGYTGSAYGSLGKLDFFNSFSSSNVVAARIEGKRDSYSHKDGRLSFYTANVNGNLKENMTLNRNGNVGIGTSSPKNKLSVNGTIWAKEVKVSLTDAADWVFEDDYNLRTLAEVENFIKSNKHLPDIPSADEFRKNDLNVAQMDNKLLQKIEELTLYAIAQGKKIKELESLNKKLLELQSRLEKLESEK